MFGLCAAMPVWFLAAPAPAADIVVLHDNGLPDGVNGYSNVTAGVFGFRRTLLDDFVVPEHHTWYVEGMRWRHVENAFMSGAPPVDMNLWLRDDDGGAPGPVFSQIDILSIETVETGRIYFSREEEDSWVTFDPVMLPAGHYWFEATVVRAHNDFWLTASPIRNSECWVNYDDLGGFMSGTQQFGVASDLAWSIEGTFDIAGPGVCCLFDGQCIVTSFQACTDAGGLYLGPDADCESASCVGACCLSDGQCFEMISGACADTGGVFQGLGVNCFPALCGAPSACCLGDGTCRYETDVFCAALGGSYAGLGTNCGAFQCVGSGLCLSPGADHDMFVPFVLGELFEAPGPDLVGVRYGGDEIAWRRNDGSGNFPFETVVLGTGNGPVALAIGDLNGDLLPDVAVAAKVARTVAIHFNSGSGLSEPWSEYPAGRQPVDVAIGDCDGDLDNDLVVVDDADDQVLFLPNDGNGTFPSFVAYPIDRPSSVALGDLDGDGDLDIAVTNRPADTVSVLLNDATGVFGTPVPYGTAEDPLDVVARDLDDDGDLDLAVVCYYADQVSVLMNNGNATFAEDMRYDVGALPAAIAVVGRADLAVANSGSDDVSILVNHGAGVFGGEKRYEAGDTARWVTAGDLDVDGDLDLIAGQGLTGVRTFLNDCSGCPGDLDFSGAVDFGDILRILGAWGTSGGPEDLDASGVVDFGDLLFVLGAWGVCG